MKNAQWEWCPLDSLFEVGAGKTMSPAARNGRSKTPFLRTSNVLWDQIDLTELDTMEIPAAELAQKSLRPGDLLVCEGGEVGRAAVWSGQLDRISFQNHLHRLRRLVTDIEPRFYVYFLQSAFTQLGLFEGAGNDTTIPNLSRNRLSDLVVPRPMLHEQRAIVAILSLVRRGTEKHQSLTRTSEELKRAAMHELFARGLRLERQKTTEIGLLPESWAVGRLDQYAEVISTRMPYSELETVTPSDAQDASLVCGIKVSDMNSEGNEIVINHSALEKKLSFEMVSRYCAPPLTIVFPKRGAAIATNKKRICATWSVFDPNIIGVRSGPALEQRYLFQWFKNFDLRTITEPGPTPQLNKKDLNPLLIPVPPTLTEQQEIADILEAIDRKINIHLRKSRALQELFLSLLHKLMTGEMKATDLDIFSLEKLAQVSA
jgi:type I restriction enzyme S subunit